MSWEIFVLSVWAGIAGIDMQNIYSHIHRPLVSGLVVGLILGDVKVGLIAGGSIELAFLGLVPVAGSQPPNPVLAGILGSAFSIMFSQDPKTVVGLVLPFAVIMSVLVTLLYTSYAFLSNRADQCAERGDVGGVARQPMLGLLGLFLLYFFMTFFPLWLGVNHAQAMFEKIPHVIIEGLTIAGGVMPAVGFAILMKIMIKRPYVAYLAIGFVLAIYLKIPVTGIAILGTALAAVDFFIRKQVVAEVASSGIVRSDAEDDEEGI